MKKIVLFISLILLLTPVISFGADLKSTAEKSPGSSDSDWCAIALLVSNGEFDRLSYSESLKKYVEEKYTEKNKLDRIKATPWHRISIVANLLGEDITNFNGVNLLNDGIFYRENLGRQGINGYIWALITLYSGDFSEPKDAINTKESIISEILKRQCDDGGFALSGNISNVDITAMSIYALSFCRDRGDVSCAIEKALNYLYGVVNTDGSFSDNGIPNAESTAQVIIALDAVGLDFNDEYFSLIYNALLSFEVNGGFSHIQGGGVDLIATYQGVCAKASVVKKEPLYYNKAKQITEDIKSIEHIIQTEDAFKEEQKVAEKETETETETKTETETEFHAKLLDEIDEDNVGNNQYTGLYVGILVVLSVSTLLFLTLRRRNEK